MRISTIAVGAAAAGALVAGVLLGANVFTSSATANPDAALAASGSSPSATPSPVSGSFRSNEDPAHEKGESAAREAQENSGNFRGGAFRSNEDPAHEKGETAEREAQENSGQAPTSR